ncbi:hypothetical protein [Sphingomonas sp. NFX23]|uniref:hypothetical protein n=1 Tax=Sphingomonas sp. NFX23 TaxID=2819532 RepID=UPI003CEDBEC4
MTAPAALPDLGAYRRFVVAFSGGKDSLATLLHLLSLGVPAHAIELHHHDVDGHRPTFMDWPCPPAYVRAIAQHFGIALYVSWREGGFARELRRDDAPTAPIAFATPTGIGRAGGNGSAGTRGLFPQTSTDLRVRWCSPALKIDVLAAAIRNQPRFLDGRTLVITGERRESSSRARYAKLEPHRTSILVAGDVVGAAHAEIFLPGLAYRSRRDPARSSFRCIRPDVRTGKAERYTWCPSRLHTSLSGTRP